jgi:predicted polyphosphate/ATP-dependent NAD kinase
MGGRVGLKGTDGSATVERARAPGAVPRAGERADLALAVVARALAGEVDVITAPGEMGEAITRGHGFMPRIAGTQPLGSTTAADAERAVSAIAAIGVTASRSTPRAACVRSPTGVRHQYGSGNRHCRRRCAR